MRKIIIPLVLVLVGALVWGIVKKKNSPELEPESTEKNAPSEKTRKKTKKSSQKASRGNELSFRIDDDPVGTLRLEGQVIDDLEQPVGNATVVLNSNPPRTATSEPDGSFYFDKLVGRSYRLIARAKSGVAGPVVAPLHESTEPIILKVSRGGQNSRWSSKTERKNIQGLALSFAVWM